MRANFAQKLAEAWRLLRTRKLGLLGVLIISAFGIMAIFTTYLSPYGVGVSQGDSSAILSPPTLQHLLGTEDLVLEEVVHAQAAGAGGHHERNVQVLGTGVLGGDGAIQTDFLSHGASVLQGMEGSIGW